MTGNHWFDVLIVIAVALLLTWLLLIALVLRRPKDKTPQLEAAYRRFSSSKGVPGGNRRQRLKLLVLGVLVILSVVWLGLLVSRGPGERAIESTATQHASPGDLSSMTARPSAPADPRNGSPEERTIQVEDSPDSATPFQIVRIQGTYRGGPNTFVQTQRWEGGRWVAFPVPTKTDQSGQFTAYVELAEPGPYRLRVVDPDSGVQSKPFVLEVKG
jgi:hypothetical protein